MPHNDDKIIDYNVENQICILRKCVGWLAGLVLVGLYDKCAATADDMSSLLSERRRRRKCSHKQHTKRAWWRPRISDAFISIHLHVHTAHKYKHIYIYTYYVWRRAKCKWPSHALVFEVCAREFLVQCWHFISTKYAVLAVPNGCVLYEVDNTV